MIYKKHIKIKDSVKDWQEAIRVVAQPLLRDGYITQNYIEKMIESVNTLGPYIVISNDIAIPHAHPDDGVIKTALSVLKLKERVQFTNGKSINVLICLAGSSSGQHMELIREISTLLIDKKMYNEIITTNDIDRLYELLKGKEG